MLSDTLVVMSYGHCSCHQTVSGTMAGCTKMVLGSRLGRPTIEV